jgi:hypothetical protein
LPGFDRIDSVPLTGIREDPDLSDDAQASIDRVAEAFFAAFDNRCGRRPVAEDLHRLFGDGATVTRIEARVPQVFDVGGFVAPRIQLLTDGSLLEFHEWEVEAETSIRGNIASRCAIYEKEGLLRGVPYSGVGRKLFHLYRTDGGWLISSILWEDD